MTLRIVLIALIPWQPAASAAREGSSMCVTLGVILAHTGTFAADMTQPQTSFRISGFSPIAEPIRRSGRPWGQEKLHSKASTPTSWQRSMISIHASFRYSSMIEAIRTRSGYLSLIRLNSSSHVPKSRSLISSIFSQPMISCDSAARRRAYRGCTLTTFEASRLIVLQMTAPQPSSNALPMTLALVPGGPDAMTSGLGSLRPSTVMLKSAMRMLVRAAYSGGPDVWQSPPITRGHWMSHDQIHSTLQKRRGLLAQLETANDVGC